MFSVSRWAGGDESIRSPETRHGRVGPGILAGQRLSCEGSGPGKGRLTVGGACWALSY
jgi:hypothetical protein